MLDMFLNAELKSKISDFIDLIIKFPINNVKAKIIEYDVEVEKEQTTEEDIIILKFKRKR